MGNFVSLCMICKNEENNIGLLMEDVCPVVEEVIVVDTGSTDNTLKILKEKKSKYPNLNINHFTWVNHFSKARNFSFSLASSKADWIFWVDGDDRVDTEKLKHFKENILDNPKVDAWMLDYIYSTLPDGTPQTILGRERFIRKSKNPKWIGAIHETVDIGVMRERYYEPFKILHKRDSKHIEPKRNLNILAKEFEKNPRDARTAYYYGKELFDHVDSKSTKILEHYLNLPGRYYDDECNARSRLARTYLAEGKHREAIKCIDEVYHLDITRKRADFYFIYGSVEETLGNYEIAIEWFKRCLMKPPEGTRVLTMEYYTWHPRKRMAECYKAMGDWNNAFKYAREVADILPGDISTEDWIKSFKAYTVSPKGGHKLVTLEFGTEVRFDSYRTQEELVPLKDISGNELKARIDYTIELPLADNSIDGIVLNKCCGVLDSELVRVLKPGGFIWSEKLIDHSDLGHLGECNYQKTNLINYVKVDPTKPVIAYRKATDLNFAPYRYRILNLLKSAKKNGFRVVEDTTNRLMHSIIEGCDVCIGLNMGNVSKAKKTIYILEVTEKLPDYSSYGITNADVINASSPMLAEYLKQKYPDKKVINVDDHFEVPSSGWL